MAVSVKLNGNPKKGTDEGVENSVIKSCLIVQAQAKSLAPVDLGNLRSSIGYVTPTEKDGDLSVKPKKGEGYVGTPVEYGIYQEFGTRKTAGQPFLRPAARALSGDPNEVMRAIFEAMKDNLNRGL